MGPLPSATGMSRSGCSPSSQFRSTVQRPAPGSDSRPRTSPSPAQDLAIVASICLGLEMSPIFNRAADFIPSVSDRLSAEAIGDVAAGEARAAATSALSRCYAVVETHSAPFGTQDRDRSSPWADPRNTLLKRRFRPVLLHWGGAHRVVSHRCNASSRGQHRVLELGCGAHRAPAARTTRCGSHRETARFLAFAGGHLLEHALTPPSEFHAVFRAGNRRPMSSEIKLAFCGEAITLTRLGQPLPIALPHR